MSNEYNYKLVDGKYVLHKGDKPYLDPMTTVAIAFDTDGGTLLKHGEPRLVKKWSEEVVTALRKSSHPELANTLVVVDGRFTLEDLDKVLNITGYMGIFYKKMLAGEAQVLDEAGNILKMDGSPLVAS